VNYRRLEMQGRYNSAQSKLPLVCILSPKKIKLAFLALFLLLVGLIAGVLFLVYASLPIENGKIKLSGLSANAKVNADNLGIPFIHAANRHDAFRILGYLHARDRLFQMELMRRKSSGTLAELFGEKAINLDIIQRDYRLEFTAQQVVSSLPDYQKSALNAYVAGINSYIEQNKILAPEFLAVNFRPEPWRLEDSILVALGMFQTLNGHEQAERMVSVMKKALPSALVNFLTPDTDIYAKPLLGGSESHRPPQPIPLSEFSALDIQIDDIAVNGVSTTGYLAGSNNWVVAGGKTNHGGAMVANDMHLGLNVPNIWYRAALQYGEQTLSGVTLPGLPVIVVGGNHHVAWGFTNVSADLLDLIKLDINPQDDQQYLTPQGWRNFDKVTSIINVKGGKQKTLELRSTIWGPVSSNPLLGQPVVIKWAALQPAAIDLGLMDMDTADSVQQAITVFNKAGGPPQNVVIADREGHIGWTYMGRFPKRHGFDGLTSLSWSNSERYWDGFIPADQLPRLVDPPEGYIVTANNRTLGRDYPYVIGYNWELGYRAHRITELINEAGKLSEQDMVAIQLDTRSELFSLYRDIALQTLDFIPNNKYQSFKQVLQSWDEYMNADSKGAALLVAFRNKLAEGVFAKVVAQCRQLDPQFTYSWHEMETPLRQILVSKPGGVLAKSFNDDWQQFFTKSLISVIEELTKNYPEIALDQLKWGETNHIKQQHVFSKNFPQLSGLLDMDQFESGGCINFCVKVLSNNFGASERLVLSPGFPEFGILQMPGGQSGHPLSKHYRDQQANWQVGKASAFLPGAVADTLVFQP
jgi:penicillin G amidase